jgi:hypothetical protein
MKVGDRAFAEVVVDHDGTLAFPTSLGGVARTPWNPEFTGIRVRNIVRAPVPREVVNVPCEVLREGECALVGDVIHFHEGEVCVVTISHTIPWSDQRDIARVLRPIKKP